MSRHVYTARFMHNGSLLQLLSLDRSKSVTSDSIQCDMVARIDDLRDAVEVAQKRRLAEGPIGVCAR